MKVWLVISILFFSCNSLAKCEDQGFRQFDFWLGDWSVTSVGGLESGRNRITREYDGCVIKESYTTELGYRGESINIYDASTHRWHQTWWIIADCCYGWMVSFMKGKWYYKGIGKMQQVLR